MSGSLVSRLAAYVLRYGLVLVLAWIGLLKFTADEAEGIRSLVSNSPFMSWMYDMWSVRTTSRVIGVFEIVTAALVAARPLSATLCAIGSALAVATFAVTLSFMLTTPGVWGDGFPRLGGSGQFLVKDFVLVGAALWSLGEALRGRQVPPYHS